MKLDLTTPALLFPAVSLLMLAYTNRFLALAALVRTLHDRWHANPDDEILERQIVSLRKRIHLVRSMQGGGVLAILLSVVSMFLLFEGWEAPARIAFVAALLSLIVSLVLSVREIQISVHALDLQLSDMETACKPGRGGSAGPFRRKQGTDPRD